MACVFTYICVFLNGAQGQRPLFACLDKRTGHNAFTLRDVLRQNRSCIDVCIVSGSLARGWAILLKAWTRSNFPWVLFRQDTSAFWLVRRKDRYLQLQNSRFYDPTAKRLDCPERVRFTGSTIIGFYVARDCSFQWFEINEVKTRLCTWMG